MGSAMKFFITGVSRGLGKALAEECLNLGHEVWGVSRSKPSGADKRLRHMQCDIADFAEVRRAADEMIGEGYIPDVFVLNAATIKEDFDGGLDLETARETFATNLFGHLYWIKIFLPLVEHKQGPATFLNVSSVAAFRAILHRKVAYPASKAAMDMVFEGMRVQFAEKRIRFLTVNLGPLADKRAAPLITASYREAALKIIATLESGRRKTHFSYPLLAGLIYKAARFVPDNLIRRIIR